MFQSGVELSFPFKDAAWIWRSLSVEIELGDVVPAEEDPAVMIPEGREEDATVMIEGDWDDNGVGVTNDRMELDGEEGEGRIDGDAEPDADTEEDKEGGDEVEFLCAKNPWRRASFKESNESHAFWISVV